jgi:hypothetical protein
MFQFSVAGIIWRDENVTLFKKKSNKALTREQNCAEINHNALYAGQDVARTRGGQLRQTHSLWYYPPIKFNTM